ncbi:MAG: hypothetical protein HKL99_10415, partial [Burkholderiales bacterium]|nr:hypothetical protein [Burkholderiales bacterium]
NFDALMAFGREFGHVNVPRDCLTPDGVRLGQWCANQRQDYKAGRMPPERQARLEALPGWAWNVLDAQLEKNFDALLAFGREFGHVNVPVGYVTPDGVRLGGWCAGQRKDYKAGRMPPGRQARFEALPGWAWSLFDAQLEKNFDALLAFGRAFGHVNVPLGYVTPDGVRLGQWCSGQRKAYKTGRMPPERQARFEALPGWTWGESINPRPKPSAGIPHLRAFAAEHGHCEVPLDYRTADGFALGTWVANQKWLFAQGGMDVERQRALESFQGWTWISATTDQADQSNSESPTAPEEKESDMQADPQEAETTEEDGGDDPWQSFGPGL